MGCIWATVRAREGGPIAFPARGRRAIHRGPVPYAAPEPLGMLRWPRTAVAEPRARRGAFLNVCVRLRFILSHSLYIIGL